MTVGWIDVLGYATSGLTLATFAQRTMLPMRIMALGANVCFIGYGAMGLFMPVLALHVILLPINLVRLRTPRWSIGPRHGWARRTGERRSHHGRVLKRTALGTRHLCGRMPKVLHPVPDVQPESGNPARHSQAPAPGQTGLPVPSWPHMLTSRDATEAAILRP